MRHNGTPTAPHPANREQDLTLRGLELMAHATAEQHKAVLELQKLFARWGGSMSPHLLTPKKPLDTIRELGGVKSFALLNFSSSTVWLGYGGASAQAGMGVPVPPLSYLQLPLETNIAEVAAIASELEANGDALVQFIRFKHLVNLGGGPLSISAGATGTVTLVPEYAAALTAGSPAGAVPVENKSGLVIAANGARKGLSIENAGAVQVSLGLGREAVEGAGLVLEPGMSWDGRIGQVIWRGQVNAIAASATQLAVAEV